MSNSLKIREKIPEFWQIKQKKINSMSKKVLERAYDVRFEIRKSFTLMRDMNGVMFCRKLDVEDSEVADS